MHSNQAFAMRDEKVAKYTDVVGGDVGMTIVLTIGGGHNCIMVASTIILKSPSRSYPKWNSNDHLIGGTYRTSDKAFIERNHFLIG